MQSLVSASSALQRAAIGRLHASATYVSPISASIPLLILPQEFLFYYEKWEPPKSKNGERTRLVSLHSSNCKTRFNLTATLQSDGQPPRDWDPYVKQTYSVYLNENENNKRKWHLSESFPSLSALFVLYLLAAYFTQATVDGLGTVDDIPVLKDLVVPEGLFKSSRRTKTRSSRASAAAHASESAPSLLAPASSSGTSASQIASAAGPSSTASRPPPQVAAPSAASRQNQALPASIYPQDLFNVQPPAYSGLPINPIPPPLQHHDAYTHTRIYTGDSYASPQSPEGYHVPPSPQFQAHMASFGYNWPAPPASVSDNACHQSPYTHPVYVASQNGDLAFHHSPAQSQFHVYGSRFQMSPSSLLHYRPVSPALSHAPSQFSASSQSQSSSESDSPAPGPVPLRTPFLSPDQLSVVLPTDGEHKYEAVPLHSIREHDSIDSEVVLAPLDTLKRYQPYKRDPTDDQTVRKLLGPVRSGTLRLPS